MTFTIIFSRLRRLPAMKKMDSGYLKHIGKRGFEISFAKIWKSRFAQARFNVEALSFLLNSFSPACFLCSPFSPSSLPFLSFTAHSLFLFSLFLLTNHLEISHIHTPGPASNIQPSYDEHSLRIFFLPWIFSLKLAFNLLHLRISWLKFKNEKIRTKNSRMEEKISHHILEPVNVLKF